MSPRLATIVVNVIGVVVGVGVDEDTVVAGLAVTGAIIVEDAREEPLAVTAAPTPTPTEVMARNTQMRESPEAPLSRYDWPSATSGENDRRRLAAQRIANSAPWSLGTAVVARMMRC